LEVIEMKKKIVIEGMSCGHCVSHVEEALYELKGVESVEVDLASKTATVSTETEVRDEDIKFAIEDAGYEVLGIETE
jgi:copper ion binding protein